MSGCILYSSSMTGWIAALAVFLWAGDEIWGCEGWLGMGGGKEEWVW